MAVIGSASTRLIVLRGDSGSGKTTTARALRPLLGPKTAVIHRAAGSGRQESLDQY